MLAIHGAGGKSGGGPAEAENTLFSRSVARIVDLIGEGEIGGPVDGLQSVFIDGVPIEAADGSRNIEGVTVVWRSGTADQAPLDGIPETEVEAIIGATLRAETGVTHRVRSNPVHAVRVTIAFPSLVRYDDRGNAGPTSVSFTIETRAAGGSWSPKQSVTVHEKNTAAAELSWRVPLSGASPIDVRVTRVTPDSDSDRVRDTITWARVTEIAEIRQSYPHSAVVGITADAERYRSQLIRREYEVYGLIVQVPSNYAPDTRTYTGIWDGTFNRAWSDNPAWCAYHILTSRRFGLGAELSTVALSAIKWRLYEIAQWCDVPVPDGRGGTEARWRFNGVIAKAVDARRLLRDVFGAFRTSVYWGGGQIVPVHDAPADPVSIVAPANTVDGEMEVASARWSDRISAVAVSFSDPDDAYRQGVELVIDDDLVEKYGYRQKDVAAMHCTSRGQAQRTGRHILVAQEYESDTLRYRGGFDQASLRPGDVIRQHDPQVAGARLAGRIRGLLDTEGIQFQIAAVQGNTITAEALPADASFFPAPETWLTMDGAQSSKEFVDSGRGRRPVIVRGEKVCIDRSQKTRGISSALFSDSNHTSRLGVFALPVLQEDADFALSFWFRISPRVRRWSGVLRCGDLAIRLTSGVDRLNFIYNISRTRHASMPARLTKDTWYLCVVQRSGGRVRVWLDDQWHDFNYQLGRIGDLLLVGDILAGQEHSSFSRSGVFAYRGHIDDARYYPNIAPFSFDREPLPGSPSAHMPLLLGLKDSPINVLSIDGNILTLQTPVDANNIGATVELSHGGVDGLMLDNLKDIPLGRQWTCYYALPSGDIESRDVSGFSANTGVAFLAATSVAPRPGAMAVLEANDVVARLWRIESVVERDDFTFDVAARAYHPDRYDAVERGVRITEPDLTLIPTGSLSAPAAVTISEHLYLESSHLHVAVTVAVAAAGDPRVALTEIQIWTPADTGYRPLAISSTGDAELRGATTGIYRARARYIAEPPSFRSPWREADITTVRGRLAPPAAPTNFLIDELPDGTRRYRWTIPADLDFAGVQLAYVEHVVGRAQPEWDDMTPMHGGILTADHFESTEPQRPGSYQIAVRSVDTSKEVSNPVFIVADLGPTRGLDVLLWECPSAIGWPGTHQRLDRSDDGRDALESNAGYTWADVPTWEDWASWAGGDGSQHLVAAEYDRGILDIGALVSFSVGWQADTSGPVALQIRVAATQAGLPAAAWQTAGEAQTFTARWLQVRWRISGDGNTLLSLDHLCWRIVAPSSEERLRDIDSANLTASTLRPGGRVLPTTLRTVTDVDLILQSVGPGWSWVLLDKSPPTVIIYDSAGNTADATIDAVLRGIK